MSKLGLCLAGGGARGGILNQVSGFSGTSIGSVNAALLATMPVEKAYQLWLGVTTDEIKRTESIFSRIRMEKIKLIENGIFTIEALRARLVDYIDEDALKRATVFVTLSKGGTHYIKKEQKTWYPCLKDYAKDDMIDMILASCSIPIVFPPVTLEDHRYYDGGVFDNVPITPLIEAGCDEIICIPLHLFDRFSLSAHHSVKLYEIRSKHLLGSHLKFDPEHSKRLYQLGYEDACAYFEDHPFRTE
jgi:NTE family protein